MASSTPQVNNGFYDFIGDRWYEAEDDPIALLRAESRLRNPWISGLIRERLGPRTRVLDLGCGAGFLSNHLAREGFDVTGLDASRGSLDVAARHDSSQTVRYIQGDALSAPFLSASFDAVTAMDLLEHIEDGDGAIREVARVLRPGGLFFFHTFNHTFLAWLLVIKGVEWFVRNTPQKMHILDLFRSPREITELCRKNGLSVAQLHGCSPVFASRAFFQLLLRGTVSPSFEFQFTNSTHVGYTGYALRVPVT